MWMLPHRFYCVTKGDSYFCMQLKEDARTGHKASCQSLIGNRIKAHQIKISRCVA